VDRVSGPLSFDRRRPRAVGGDERRAEP